MINKFGKINLMLSPGSCLFYMLALFFCHAPLCSVDGVWNTWSTWDSCTQTCGGGTKSRNRTCIFKPDNGPHGADCTGNTTDVVDCNTQQCPGLLCFVIFQLHLPKTLANGPLCAQFFPCHLIHGFDFYTFSFVNSLLIYL